MSRILYDSVNGTSRPGYKYDRCGNLINPRKERKRELRKLYITRKIKRINRAERLNGAT